MRSNKKLIIVITIVLALAVASGVFAYLYIMTDLFKSSNELFAKYFVQNTETFEKIMDLQVVKSYEQLKNENKYESNTNIKMVHSEGGEISNPLNNLSAKLDIQNNNEEQYMYAIAKVLYDNEEYLNAEIIRDQGQYGIRFWDVAKKFVTIKNDENVESIANDIGIDANQLQTLINIIDGSQQIISNEQKSELKDKYLNIIKTGISNGTFEKQKNALITYNNITTKTNAYSAFLNSEQVKGLLTEIVNKLKTETQQVGMEFLTELIDKIEIPTVKIIVYEQNKQTIRTVLEIGMHKIIIENIEQDGKIESNIKHLNSNQEIQYETYIIKTNSNNQEILEIAINVNDKEKTNVINVSNETQVLEKEMTNKFEVSYEEGIITTAIVLENKVIKGDTFEKIESLSSNNYLLLNSNEGEARKQFINTYKERVLEKINEKINLLTDKLMITNDMPENEEIEEQISNVEINKFNAKFEFYTGDEVSAENVRKLLDVVRNNISSHTITTIENEEVENQEKIKNIIKIYIEQERVNEASMTDILEKIDDNQKYKVLISYKEGNGLIDYITITEI